MTSAGAGSDEPELSRIVERAAFFHERLDPRFLPASSPNQADADERLARWSRQIADGDADRFRRRFEWDGLTLEKVRRIAAGVRLSDSSALPQWTEILRSAMLQAERLASRTLAEAEAGDFCLRQGTPLPFEHLMAFFVHCAVKRVKAAGHARWRGLRVGARGALVRDLLQTLCTASQYALWVEFGVWRNLRAAVAPASGPGQRIYYESWIRDMAQSGMRGLFRTYPVLARVLAERTSNWISSVVEFLERLDQDREALRVALRNGNRLGRVKRIRAGLSDPHGRGRSVLEIEFDGGLSCFYKPRNLDCDWTLRNILRSLACRLPLPLRTVECVCRETHGWVEAIPWQPCAGKAQVERCFRRFGVLMAVLYLLDCSDCHCENIVAAGEHPVLVDAETLLQPCLSPAEVGRPRDASSVAAEALFSKSLFRLGMLPRWIEGSELPFNPGALNTSNQRIARQPARTWRHVNTDLMRPAIERSPVQRRPSDVVTSGKLVDAADHAAEVVAGFEQAYRALMKTPLEMLGSEEQFRALEQLRPRFLFRNTSVYSKTLDHCRDPRWLRDGIDQSIACETLYRTLLFAPERPPAWPLLRAEQKALLEGDIPRFVFNSATGVIEEAEPCRGAAPVQVPAASARLRARWSGLSEPELTRQAALIQLALNPHEISEPAPGDDAKGDLQPAGDLESDCLAQAVQIGERIRDNAITSGRELIWLTRAYQPGSQIWQVQPMSARMYDGTCGVALFLAALEAASQSGFRDLAIRAFETALDSKTASWRNEMGAGTGYGSVIYAHARGAELLGEPRLASKAESLAANLTIAQIQADRHFDLIRGSAGLILALLAAHGMRRQDWLVAHAKACGDHLLSNRSAAPDGKRAWRTIGDRILCGFSHGAAGIAYSLRCLFRVTGEQRYCNAAAEAEAYEDSLYSVQERNWPDLLARTASDKPRFRNSWCHGAAGIILGRLAGQPASRSTTDKILQSALEGLKVASAAALDHPCCGNCGRIETLLEAAHRLRRPEYRQSARTLAVRMIQRARAERKYRLGTPNGFCSLSFHQGLAGIGYQLLRVADRTRFPSALLWS